MARISSAHIAFLPTEDTDEFTSWKKARQNYIFDIGNYLLRCSESAVIQVFDSWELDIIEQEKSDKTQNYFTALLIISILHHFSRSYDQTKLHIPFVTKMLRHKYRPINKTAAIVFKYLAIELVDNIEFLREIINNDITTSLLNHQHLYSSLLILSTAGHYRFSHILLPIVFSATTNNLQIIWSSVISDDLELRLVAVKCIDAHIRGLRSIANKKDRKTSIESLFNDCMLQFQVSQITNHGPLLVCMSIFTNSMYKYIDVPSLYESVINILNINNEISDFSAFTLLYEILKRFPHLFTPESVQIIISHLISSCQRFPSSCRLFLLIDSFIKKLNFYMIPVNFIIDFLKATIKSPKFKPQHQIVFTILKTLFLISRNVSVPSSFFIEAEPSFAYIEALKLRMSIFNDLKPTLLKYFLDGVNPKSTKNQSLISLYIVKTFSSQIIYDKHELFNQITILTASKYEEVRLMTAEVLSLLNIQQSFDELLILALFDESKRVRLSAVKEFRYPHLIAHNEMVTQILNDPSFKIRRIAIPIVAQIIPYNPLLFILPATSFVQHTILSISSTSDPLLCTRISSLFPLIAEYFVPFCQAFIPEIIKTCVLFLDIKRNHSDVQNESQTKQELMFSSEIEKELNYQNMLNSKSENIGIQSKKEHSKSSNFNISDDSIPKDEVKIEYIKLRDLSTDEHPLIANRTPFDKTSPNLNRIFKILNQELIDRRDANLFLTIKQLSSHLLPYITQLIRIFIKTFSTRRSEIVLSNALDALIEIIETIPLASDISITQQKLIPTLMILLKNQSNIASQANSAIKKDNNDLFSHQHSSNNSLSSSFSNSYSSSLKASTTFSQSIEINKEMNSEFHHIPITQSIDSDLNEINKQQSLSVAVKILKVMGTIGITSFPTSRVEKSIESDPITEFDLNSPSFYANFVISELLKKLNEPQSSIFEVITAIFAKEADTACQYLEIIIDSFCQALLISKSQQKDFLFNQLEIISYFARERMAPYVSTLLPFIISNINHHSVLRFCVCLSYFLKGEFLQAGQILYRFALRIFRDLFEPVVNSPMSSISNFFSFFSSEVVKSSISLLRSSQSLEVLSKNLKHQSSELILPKIDDRSLNYFEYLFKLIQSLILFQHQPIESFISECEQSFHNFTISMNSLSMNSMPTISASDLLLLVINSLIILIQNGDCQFETTVLVRMCIQFLKSPLKSQIFQLLFSLSVYCNLPPDVISFICFQEKINNPSIAMLKDFIKDRSIPMDTFLTKKTFSISIQIPDYVPLLTNKQLITIQQNSTDNKIVMNDPVNTVSKSNQVIQFSYSFSFDDFPEEQYGNIEKWYEDLCYAVIAQSPSIAIRACHKIVHNSPSFRATIFPVAFLSCWRITSIEDKKKFSSIIQNIFENEENANQIFVRLAEFLERADQPFFMSHFITACACKSPAMAMHFLVRHIKENPGDLKAIEYILTLNMRLNLIDSSVGILQTFKLKTAGTWYERIGDWSSALHFYQNQHSKKHSNTDQLDYSKCSFKNDICKDDIPPMLRCFAKLEKWDEIVKFTRVFESMSKEQRQENAIWFAWAFYRSHDYQKASYYIKEFGDTEDLNMMLFKELFLVATNQIELAKGFIDQMMQLLVKDCNIYSALNANQADKNLTYANYMVELQEAIELKSLKASMNSPNKMAKDNLMFMHDDIMKRWRRRLQFHSGDSYSWMILIEIRNLAVNPIDNHKTYLKLMSALVKERRFELVHAFWKDIMQGIHEPDVQISYHKIKWAQDQKYEAIFSLHLLNYLYDSENVSFEQFKLEFDRIPQKVKTDFYENIIKQNKFYQNESSQNDINTFYQFGQILRGKTKLTPKEKSRMYRLEGTYRNQLYVFKKRIPYLVKTIDLFEKACQLLPNDYRNWAQFALAASSAFNENNDLYVAKAMQGFLKAAKLLQTNNLEFLLLLFSLFFRYGCKTQSLDLPEELINLNPEIIQQILPQIVCQINHNEPTVRNVVHQILIRFSKQHFQALVFSLHLLVESTDKMKSSIALDLFFKLSQEHPQIASEAKMMVDGFLKSSITPYEKWMETLDIAYLESKVSTQRSMNMLSELFSSVQNPTCDMENSFLVSLEAPIKTCYEAFQHFEQRDTPSNHLWIHLKRLYQIIRDKFKKVEEIDLNQISEKLVSYRGFLMSIPGTYEIKSNNESTRIHSIDEKLPVLSTQQRPRLLYMTDISSKKWKFLMKGREDLRLDQRIMQFFNLVNSLIMTDKQTSNLNITISKYSIIPFSPNAGLISWVTGTDTLHQLVIDYRKSQMIPLWGENDILQHFAPQENLNTLTSLQKIELWGLISANFKADELNETFWIKSPDAVSWMQRVDTFVKSTALMSMAGYVIGIGDRHPSNIMIQRETGHVVHIDFGDSFEVAINRDRMPEKVPFRLTRMIVNAFGVTGVNGTFRAACEKYMRLIRDNKSSIIAQLEIFVHEPIFVNNDHDNSKNKILDRIIEKLNGQDPVFTIPRSNQNASSYQSLDLNNHLSSISEFALSDASFIDEEENENDIIISDELTVEQQVDDLIRIASDPYRYVQHYFGWCPFW